MSESGQDRRIFIDADSFPRIETLQVAVPATFMRRAARPSAAAETELLFGTRFHVHRYGRGWVWGQAECLLPGRLYPGYVGWVRSRDLKKSTDLPTHKVTAISAPVFSNADIKSPVLYHLPISATLIVTMDGKFGKIAGGFIHKNHIAALTKPSAHADWVAVAESLLGRPYIWGGISSAGLDCSGLVQTALRVYGSDAPRDTDQQANIGKPVAVQDNLSGLKRGDLIFWKGHVGIMTSSTRLLHANAHHMCVACEPLTTAVKRIGNITAIRRLSL